MKYQHSEDLLARELLELPLFRNHYNMTRKLSETVFSFVENSGALRLAKCPRSKIATALAITSGNTNPVVGFAPMKESPFYHGTSGPEWIAKAIEVLAKRHPTAAPPNPWPLQCAGVITINLCRSSSVHEEIREVRGRGWIPVLVVLCEPGPPDCQIGAYVHALPPLEPGSGRSSSSFHDVEERQP